MRVSAQKQISVFEKLMARIKIKGLLFYPKKSFPFRKNAQRVAKKRALIE